MRQRLAMILLYLAGGLVFGGIAITMFFQVVWLGVLFTAIGFALTLVGARILQQAQNPPNPRQRKRRK